MKLTPKLAHVAGTDAGNASMRKAGRKIWNADDYNAASRVENELLDVIDTK